MGWAALSVKSISNVASDAYFPVIVGAFAFFFKVGNKCICLFKIERHLRSPRASLDNPFVEVLLR